jgi:hypothetical protein
MNKTLLSPTYVQGGRLSIIAHEQDVTFVPHLYREGNTELFLLVRALSCNLPGRSVSSLAMGVSEDYAAVVCSQG